MKAWANFKFPLKRAFRLIHLTVSLIKHYRRHRLCIQVLSANSLLLTLPKVEFHTWKEKCGSELSTIKRTREIDLSYIHSPRWSLYHFIRWVTVISYPPLFTGGSPLNAQQESSRRQRRGHSRHDLGEDWHWRSVDKGHPARRTPHQSSFCPGWLAAERRW